ncbi:diguanylate phosphodiesterase [Novosphingobium sp. PC22D]|uniref:EAL domain-containing protein n=1 Tax=Novosphingobium sp. PC22D TaxID=1962403 RepID=UPI000BF136B7|nr:EAL domain-containing protein [Novosphingobium sp. PC22D]PEQ12823.1 diguanylate phosphodiesterase [Novosphingobium sp. PC22D]
MVGKCQGCKQGEGLPFGIRTAFQPIVDLESGRPYAYEALVRGQSAESAGEILSLVTDENRYAFDQACRVNAINEAVDAGLLETDAKLSINFLPNAVYSPLACIKLTLATALARGLPSSRLIFEFTENEQLDPVHVREIVKTYRALGFSTSIDDFGSGHAGLALLANLATDALKLDRDLVRGIDVCPRRKSIVKSIVGLSCDLGLLLVAEGVETEPELRTLQDLGIRYVQGFLIARPRIGVLPPIDTGLSLSRDAA